jgi:SOS-response transcriptional repressor LexA
MQNNERFIGKKIKEIRISKEMSIEKLAQIVGVSNTTIYRIERGQEPGAINLLKIANALEISSDKLLGIEKDNFFNKINSNKVIPIYDKNIDDLENFPEQNILDYISIPKNKNADFALIIEENSMNPKFKTGDIVFFKKQSFLKNGEIGAISYNEKKVVIKKYLQVSENEVQLISINSNCPTIVIKGDLQKTLKFFGKVIGYLCWE